ncbi:MAG: hypothetical protein IH626_02070 [Rhodospirillales bacterium]|nr:hypothetical protein [Rhodospirillales bacterium]
MPTAASVHGTTGELPLARFFRDEASVLRPIDGRPPFRQVRKLVRKVQVDCAVEVNTNAYSVPWQLIGESVVVTLSAERVVIRHAGNVVAEHAEGAGRKQRIVDRRHFLGIAGQAERHPAPTSAEPPPDLLRPLCEYERLVGGGSHCLS